MPRKKKRTKSIRAKKKLPRARGRNTTPKRAKKKALKKRILIGASRPPAAQPVRAAGQPAKMLTAYDVVLHNFDIAAAKLQLSDEVKQLIKTPDRELRVELPMIMDDGKLNTLIGYRVQHNNARGPNKGGSAIIPMLISMKYGRSRH